MKNGHGTGPTLGALILFVVAVLLVVAGTGYAVYQGSRAAAAKGAEIATLCDEQRDVGTAPITAQSSKLGVKLIVDFRNAYAGLGCSGHLPPPSPELLRLAGRYGVKVAH